MTFHCAVRNEMSEVQSFVSLPNFITSTYTPEERHSMAKARVPFRSHGSQRETSLQLTVNAGISCLPFLSPQCRIAGVPQDGFSPGNGTRFPRKCSDSELSRRKAKGYFPKLQQLLCLS